MKHLFSYIVFGFWIFNCAVVCAADTVALPDDFPGVGTRKILQEYYAEEDEDKKIDLKNQAVIMYEAAGYLYQKYTPEEIAEEDFIEVMRPFFPNYDDEQLEDRRHLLYTGIGAYKYGKQKYMDFVNKYLVPSTYKTVCSDADYDHPDEIAYVEVPEGEFVKVYNFKKFLTYSENPDERKAISKYEARKKDGNALEQFNDAMQKIEWKKVALYGIKYDNPLYSTNGVSPIQQTEAGAVRLVTDGAFIDGRRELKIGIMEMVNPEHFVLANNLSLRLRKPQIDLSQSQNIEPDYEIFYPVPLKSQLYPEAYKYTGTFMIMVSIRPTDPEKPIILRAGVDITECDYHLECSPQHFVFEQGLKPHGDELFGNGMENYFFRAQMVMPQPQTKHLTLKDFTVQKDTAGQSLFLEFDTSKSVNTFNVFMEETGADTTFKEPLVSLRDNKIFVRVEPSEKDAGRDLSNAEYIITANLNNKEFLRQTLVPQQPHLANMPTADFGFGFFVWAFIGGLLLNLMPCVLPLWAYKLLEMYALHKKSTEVIRAELKQILLGLGVVCAVVFVALLAVQTYCLPYVWGTQLQYMPYVMTMLFFGLVLIKILPYVVENTPRDKMRSLNYALGILGGAAAVSCGAPYLSEALTAAVNDRRIILCLTYVAVLCGFYLPFAVLMKIEAPQKLLNFLHRNKESVLKVTKFALYLAYAWYLLLIYWQTGFIFASKIFVATLAVWFVTDIFLKFLQYLNDVHDESITLHYIERVRCGSYAVIVALSLVCVIIASVSAIHRQNKNRQLNAAGTVDTVSIEDINREIEEGNAVLVTVETDWCFMCRLNEMMVFNQPNFNKWEQQYHLKHIRVNQAAFDTDITDYMKRYTGSVSVPFYVLYTPIIRSGVVLPSRPTVESMDRLLIYNKKD